MSSPFPTDINHAVVRLIGYNASTRVVSYGSVMSNMQVFLQWQAKTAYTSVPILRADQAQQASAALERWTGHTLTRYIRNCSDRYGLVCQRARISKE